MRTTSPAVSKKGQAQRSLQTRKCDAKTKRQPRASEARFAPVALLEEHFLSGERPFSFSYFNPGATEVFLAGEFNRWQPDVTPLEKSDGGLWHVEVILGPGRYEYRFIVDGIWQEDPMSKAFTANPFGGLNSLVVVTD